MGHAPAQQWVQAQRQQRGLVAPVFEQLALAARAPGELVEGGRRVAAQTGEQRQVMGADQGVDRIDLQHAQALQHALERGERRRGFGLLAKALGRQRQAPSLVDGQVKRQSRTSLLILQCLPHCIRGQARYSRIL
ncbi:hypothetical protein D3C80_1639950 [compost metagenome]